MIIQSERFGTSLSQALKVYADSLRQRRRLRSEAAVAKAGIKMLFPIVLFILPALFVITLAPGVLSVLHDLKRVSGRPGRPMSTDTRMPPLRLSACSRELADRRLKKFRALHAVYLPATARVVVL